MKGGGGAPIEESDIMYQDDLVCILKPEVKKGIIVLTNYEQPPNTESLCILGLKTYMGRLPIGSLGAHAVQRLLGCLRVS